MPRGRSAARREPDSRNVNVTATLGDAARSFRLTLPELPPEDRWFVATFNVQLSASDGANVVGSQIIGGVAETTCVLPAVPTPLPEPMMAGNCEIPAGYLEVTTPAATEHGQRVFDSPDQVIRIYVRADGSCVRLLGGVPPVPEFVPDVLPSVTGIADVGPTRVLPGTGAGATHRAFQWWLIPFVLLTSGGPLALAGLMARRREHPSEKA